MTQKNIGRHRITESIASGAQGAVYQAFDPESNRIVVLKVLHELASTDEAYLERFRREASVMASIDHPNVVTIFDVGSDGDTHYLAMELLPQNLGKVMATGRLAVENTVYFATQIADGLSAAHDAGVIHRDIKPQNILIDPEGVAKVTDFGIARAQALPSMTHTGTVMGTPYYMSPEQAINKDVDGRTDIYSLGSVLYQMLAGEVVFKATNPY